MFFGFSIKGNSFIMAKYLVIVESPTKVKTIKKFLGKNYEVMASQGHVRDLPKSSLGIDIDHDFEPRYITIRGKGQLLASLRKEAKKADKIYLATDPDREGEAISWHLLAALNVDPAKPIQRITFNEITKNAVKEAIKHPREIDMDLVDAQQARRILDRMVGYRISPLLWAKVKRGLSAGRVQSAALRMICDRESQIDAFIPREYYTLDVILKADSMTGPLLAHYYGDEEGKKEIGSKDQLREILDSLQGADYAVSSITKTRRERKSPLPFTTSTLQQEASKVLNFAIQKTMRIAQQLYEGVDIKGSGTVGLITYLRTDSTRVAREAREAAASFIESNYGSDYRKEYHSGKKSGSVQDAHEAIRPADLTRIPSQIKDSLSRDQFRLYQLIWKRFMASQMANAVYETSNVKIGAKESVFTVSSSRVLFDGYTLIYMNADDKEGEDKQNLEKIKRDTKLSFQSFDEKQHFTQPPAHFTEASLVHMLEELGIGRPSTYSPIVSTLLKRRYIVKEGRSIFVTELGQVVNDIMKESFPSIVDQNFTANMERLLDGVEEGKVEWKSLVRNFYPDLDASVQKAERELEKVQIKEELSDVVCENCGRQMVIKYGPHGKFLACPGFPDCRNTKPYLEKIGVPCPLCGKDVVLKRTRKGRIYYGCEDNPSCEFMSWNRPVKEACPKCGKYMLIKGNKIVCSDPACGYSRAREDKES